MWTSDPGRPESCLVGGRPVSESSDSDACFQLARIWLDQCVATDALDDSENHGPDSFCKAWPGINKLMQSVNGTPVRPKHRTFQISERRFVPRRTIKIGSLSDVESIHLVCHDEGEDKSEEYDIQWATLSHCWGGSAPLITTSTNIARWQVGIPFDSLPPTFRDAVTIAHRLDIRHLWIDSLCIIQDSPKDWVTQASQMGDIYRYGLLNISASNAKTCFDGILSARTEPFKPINIPLKSKKHHLSSSMLIRGENWASAHDRLLTTSPLNNRGWVLQESLLSPRTLHYAQRQMHWECSHCTLIESSIMPTGVSGISDRFALAHWTSNKMVLPAGIAQQSLTQLVPERDVIKRDDLYNTWLQIIPNYTARNLTRQSDILPALAGLASIFQAYLGDRYLAGLWEGDLLRGLLWRVKEPSQIKSAEPRCPSWSWASAVGTVIPGIGVNENAFAPRLIGELAARVQDARTYSDGQIVPSNHFTAVSGGEIKLVGYLHQRTHSWSRPYEAETMKSRRGKPWPTYELCAEDQDLHFDIEEDIEKHQNIVFLHIGAWEWRPRDRYVIKTFAGLLLKPQDPRKLVFSRCGIVKLQVRISEKNWHSFSWHDGVEQMIAERWKKETITVI